jgi:hypothetical protein
MIERVILGFGGITLAVYGLIERTMAMVCARLTLHRGEPSERGA